jgi:hypothetical protein
MYDDRLLVWFICSLNIILYNPGISHSPFTEFTESNDMIFGILQLIVNNAFQIFVLFYLQFILTRSILSLLEMLQLYSPCDQ